MKFFINGEDISKYLKNLKISISVFFAFFYQNSNFKQKNAATLKKFAFKTEIEVVKSLRPLVLGKREGWNGALRLSPNLKT